MHLEWNRYGKAQVRLVRVFRSRDPHELVDLTVDVQLEGAFDAVYRDGDNATCLATDTMKNTVYAFAKDGDLSSPEAFGLQLAGHFIEQAAVQRVGVTLVEQPWERLSVKNAPHPHAFAQPGMEERTVLVVRSKDDVAVTSGLQNLVVLKTTDSAFEGFPRDGYTTLPETSDRILATSITATWTHRPGATEFGNRDAIRTALLETFAVHDSRSVQHTLYAMAQAALNAAPTIDDITLSLPNRHHLLVNLRPFGLDNPNEVFVATTEPFGLIEARVSRSAQSGD